MKILRNDKTYKLKDDYNWDFIGYCNFFLPSKDGLLSF